LFFFGGVTRRLAQLAQEKPPEPQPDETDGPALEEDELTAKVESWRSTASEPHFWQ